MFGKQSVTAGVVAALALAATFTIHRDATRTGSVFVHEPPHGQWIRDADPFALKATHEPSASAYRTRFTVIGDLPSAPLTLRATGRTTVLLDGAEIAQFPDSVEWNQPRTVELAPRLATGEHELEIRVANLGPGILAASIAPLGVATGTDWLARRDDRDWRPAALASDPAPSALGTQMAALAQPARIWFIGAVALSAAFGALVWRRHAVVRSSASQLRALLLGIWGLIAVVDFFALPSAMGMDYGGHLAYVQFILERGALPLATDGWEMFQAPLYYLLCAGMATILGFDGLTERLFRLISIASALAQIEIAYRLARRTFPEREDVQKVAITVSALLPMGFAISQGIGNEPLHAALSALTLLWAVRLVQRDELHLRDAVALGAIWGLALLAKATAVLLAAPLAYALLARIRRRPADWQRELAGACLAGLASAGIAGWYYARNWVLLGAPVSLGTAFTGDSLPPTGFWWQEPGYRMVSQLFGFGAALVQPFDAASRSFWDIFYVTLWADGNMGSMISLDAIPPWNYAPMLASLWLALLPGTLIALGFARALRASRERASEVIEMSAIALATYVTAALLLFVRMPVYSQGKASYALALTPVFGLLAGAGFRCVAKSEPARVALCAGLFGWAALVLCSYFVV